MRTDEMYLRGLAYVTASAIVTAAAAAAHGSPQPARATIAQVDWIAGSWRGSAGPVVYEERWTEPAGGAMLAVARTVKDGRMTAFEFLRIVERNGGLVYVAQPNGRPPTEFTLTRLDGRSATFENAAHDFPKTIRYAIRPDGTLEATTSGDDPQDSQTFLFRRQNP